MGERMETSGDGVDAVECACEDEVVVYGELVEALSKIALVDQTASFVDYY